uniref:Metallophosphoesterase n=1 Tax=Solibacter usitatus (strain Ellin6076) TaxID=234267 RepID=Q01UD5_SOLUE
MRIWDFRRGDDDDNRTSPHGGGLRRVLTSAALEFNYATAAIGFLILVIGPAMLVGIVPSVLATYVRLKFSAAASLGYTPMVAVGVLALLLAAALWVGRPLLPKAVENFWHLHYTLVFPVFVAVREILRSIFEKFSRRTATVEELERKRRLGTVLGALLFAGGGIALALTVDLSTGLQLVDVEHVRPWAVATAALGNAAIILGLSTTAESLYWVWRELRFRGHVLDWAPRPPQPGSATGRVAHLSDLHFVGERYGCRMEVGTQGPRGNRCIRRALCKLTAIHASSPVDRVLVTGDVTDDGTRAEWAEFIDLFRNYPDLRARLSFVPGNHDVNIVDRNNPGRFDLPGSASQSLRKLRVVLALDALQGDRAHIVDRTSGGLGPTLKEYLREDGRAERLRALAQNGAVRGRREMSKVWDAIFPLVEPPAAGHRYGLILLNSNARSHFSLTNAIGVVNPSQLKALKSILRGSPHSAWMILLHHQVVEYPVSSISLTDRIGLALVNAPDVLAAIAPHASRCIVLHGHRHRDWIGTCQDVVLCSAPSVTLGCQDGDRGSFHIHEFALGTDGAMQLTATERVEVA